MTSTLTTPKKSLRNPNILFPNKTKNKLVLFKNAFLDFSTFP